MTFRKKSPLESPEWRTIPWLRNTKSVTDKLIDVLVDIPGYLEDLDDAGAEPDAARAEQLRHDLVLNYQKSIDDL